VRSWRFPARCLSVRAHIAALIGFACDQWCNCQASYGICSRTATQRHKGRGSLRQLGPSSRGRWHPEMGDIVQMCPPLATQLPVTITASSHMCNTSKNPFSHTQVPKVCVGHRLLVQHASTICMTLVQGQSQSHQQRRRAWHLVLQIASKWWACPCVRCPSISGYQEIRSQAPYNNMPINT
jgi:hypothetical protein